MRDLVIIGSGPAGLSAGGGWPAIVAARLRWCGASR